MSENQVFPTSNQNIPILAASSADIETPHPVLGTVPADTAQGNQAILYLAAGCFWGVEKILWNTPGVINTSVGYTSGTNDNPNYLLVCNGVTGHAETVRVLYDRDQISDEKLLSIFWQNHDPTQLDRQGNDIGSQYRSAIWATDRQQLVAANRVKTAYQKRLSDAGYGPIVTSIESFGAEQKFYLAEDYHQAYLWKNPQGYCNHGFNGVECPSGLLPEAS